MNKNLSEELIDLENEDQKLVDVGKEIINPQQNRQ